VGVGKDGRWEMGGEQERKDRQIDREIERQIERQNIYI
jgi:hypothetical protein